MPPTMQIDNQSLTVFSNLDDMTKLSTLSFVDGQDAPYIHVASGNADGAIRITNVATPTSASDATTKEYVDSIVKGLTIKQPVRLLVSTNTPLTTLVPGYQVDGVALMMDDRVLLIAQTNEVENGIYVIHGTTAVRSPDLPDGMSATGVYVFVDQGTTYKDRSYVCTTNVTDANGQQTAVAGSNTLQWTLFSAQSDALAGSGLVTGSGNKLNVEVDGATIEIVANALRIKNPDIKVKVERGLLRSTTNGTIVDTPTVDDANPAVMGKTVALGSNITVAPDFTVLPDLQNVNTFSATNTFTDTKNATWTTDGSTTTLEGAIVVNTGGVAIRQDVIASQARLKGVSDSTSATTGTLVVDGGVGIAKAIHCGGDVHAQAVHAVSADVASWSTVNPLEGALTVDGSAVVRTELHAATVNVHATTDSTSVSTGAVVIGGGLGVAHNITAETTHLTGTTASTSTTTGALTVAGGVGVVGDLHVHDIQTETAHVNATTVSVSTSTGALVVQGGAGIAQNLYVGNEAQIASIVHCNAVTDATWHATDALGGALVVEGGLSVRKDMHSTNLRVHSTTPSTSQTTGALVVSGGVGVAGDLYCNNTYNMSDERLKKNVKTLDDALDRVCNMRGCSFEWNERMTGLENTSCIGVIAQELKEQAPLCVSHDPVSDLYAVEPECRLMRTVPC